MTLESVVSMLLRHELLDIRPETWGAGIAVVEDEGIDAPANAYDCTYCAWRAAVHSALTFALTNLARDFSVYAI